MLHIIFLWAARHLIAESSLIGSTYRSVDETDFYILETWAKRFDLKKKIHWSYWDSFQAEEYSNKLKSSFLYTYKLK